MQVVINSFPSERLLVLRERAAGTYYASAYFMAKIAAETATQLPIPIVFSAIVYWLVGLQPDASKFFIFAAFMVLCNLAGEALDDCTVTAVGKMCGSPGGLHTASKSAGRYARGCRGIHMYESNCKPFSL